MIDSDFDLEQERTLNNKSVGVDYNTWKILVTWSEQECRSVGGQIRYLVKKYAPAQLKTFEEPSPTISELPLPSSSVTRIKFEEELEEEKAWEHKRLTQVRFTKEPNSQRGAILDTMIAYNDPITNSEIATLTGLDIERVQKQTAGMYRKGVLKRRKNLSKRRDIFQYIIFPAALIKYQNSKR
jgi:hypothetical protein